MQLKEDGLSCWRTVGGLSRHHRSLWRMTAGSGWRSCPGGPAWSHWVDQRAPSSAVQDLQLWVQTLYWVLPAFVNHLDPAVSGHPVLLLPVTKTEPESLSGDETDVSDSHVEGVSPCGTCPRVRREGVCLDWCWHDFFEGGARQQLPGEDALLFSFCWSECGGELHPWRGGPWTTNQSVRSLNN